MFIPKGQTQPNQNFINHCYIYQANQFMPLVFTILQTNLKALLQLINQMFYHFFCFVSIKFRILQKHFLDFLFLFFVLQFLFSIFYFFISFLHILYRDFLITIFLFSFQCLFSRHYFFLLNQHFLHYWLLFLLLIINH